jgi:hypothetical protein
MDQDSNTDFGSETIEDVAIAIETALASLENLCFDKADFRHQVIVGLQLSIVEQAHSAMILLKSEMVFDAKIILRSALEHYVELTNCTTDDSYYSAIQEKFAWNIRETLTEAQSGNPFFALIAIEIPVEDELAEWEQKSDEIRDLGGRKKPIN